MPAAFQELIGWKPTRGLLSNQGVVPACRSLDCISVFTNDTADVVLVAEVVSRFDAADPFAREVSGSQAFEETFRLGVPCYLDFVGDPDTPGLFTEARKRLESIGGVAVEIDLTPFTEAAKLLYEGPWVTERWAAVGDFVEQHPDAVFPVTVEVWKLSPADFGEFVSKIPAPLGMGKVLLESGEEVCGFIAEPRATQGAEEITHHGGWREWLEARF